MGTIYPVPDAADKMEQAWAPALAARFGIAEDTFRTQPVRFMDYPSDGCRLELMDGSVVQMRRAFAIISVELRAVALFSEHCGHHVFPLHDCKVFEGDALVYPPAG